tara:strand:- start:2003 stop:3202 length:1200 start_codon:yes stop_codon:yes gene_type:complete
MASNSKNIAELLNNSATVPDAKITQSSVTQHVTPTDLTPVKQDLALVAFDAIQTDNRSALELPNSFVDQYQDANDIATFTSCQRGTDEKIESLADSVAEYNVFADETWSGSIDVTGDNTLGYTVNGSAKAAQSTATGSGHCRTTTSETANAKYEFEFQIQRKAGGGGPGWIFMVNKNNEQSGFDYTGNQFTAGGQRVHANANNDVGDRFKWIWDGRTGVGNQNIITSFDDLDENGSYENESTAFYGAGGTYQGGSFTSTTATTVGWFMSFWRDSGNSWQIALKAGTKTTTARNATGNFVSTAQTASSSTTQMSMVVMYEDTSGTASLNTDLVGALSANNGSNFTTVTLSAAPNLSSNIKVAKSNKVTVTAGTQCKYRINFANQADGSKITKVLGVAMLY